jgi:hypothetical protein
VDDKPSEQRILVGPLEPIDEYEPELYVTPAEEDEVEFVSPSVPGRRVRKNSSQPSGQD